MMSIGGAGLGQAGTARAALAQPRLSPSVPHGPVPHKFLSPDFCPSSAADSCSTPAAPCCTRLERVDLQRGHVCLLQPGVPKSSISGWQEACAMVAVPPSLSCRACPALGSWGTVTAADGTEGAGRECLVREVSNWQPAMSSDFTSHSSAPIALPCCHPACTLILCPGRSCPHALTPPHLLLPLSAQHLPAPPFPGCLVQPHPPRGPSVSPSASAASRMANQAGASAGTVAAQPLDGAPRPPTRAWAPHPGLGRLVSAGVPRSTSTEIRLQPHTATGVPAGEPAAVGGRASQCLCPPAAAAGSWAWCWGGEDGTARALGGSKVRPGWCPAVGDHSCSEEPMRVPPPGAAGCLLSPLAHTVRRGGQAGCCSGLRGARSSMAGAGALSVRADVAGLVTRQPQGQALPGPAGRLGSVPSAGLAANTANARALCGTPLEGLVGAGSPLRARGVRS